MCFWSLDQRGEYQKDNSNNNTTNNKLEINMHHLRSNAIPAGHVQYPLSNSYEILCRWEIPNFSQVRSNFNIIGMKMWAEVAQTRKKFEFLV